MLRRGWKYVALAFGLFNVPLGLIVVMYLSITQSGALSIIVGVVILAIYVPAWYYSRYEHSKAQNIVNHRVVGAIKKHCKLPCLLDL